MQTVESFQAEHGTVELPDRDLSEFAVFFKVSRLAQDVRVLLRNPACLLQQVFVHRSCLLLFSVAVVSAVVAVIYSLCRTLPRPRLAERSIAMADKVHPYLVHTGGLTPEERQSLLSFLDRSSFMFPQLLCRPPRGAPDYIVYSYLSRDDFSALGFPVPCLWGDLSGRDLTSL